MTTKSEAELEAMRAGGRILSDVISAVLREVRVDADLRELDALAERQIKKAGAHPAFKGYHNFPYATCLSLNDEVVHGMPRNYRLQSGDVIGVDIGVLYRDFYTDSAVTVGLGEVSADDQHLIETTKEALWIGVKMVKPGVKLGDIQAAIQQHIEEAALTVVRDLCGHGIGRGLQEDPQIPNFGKAGTGPILEVGQTFSLEPMVTFRSAHVATKADGWTVVTLDGKKAAHFEHTLAVTSDGVEVLTLRPDEHP